MTKEFFMRKQFIKYVSQNMLGMLGMSLYILADTYFISRAVGPNGIAALNLVLPLYNLIFAIGAMIGIGSAIRFVVERNKKNPDAAGYFFHALAWAGIISILFIMVGIFLPDKLVALLGGDATIVATGTSYTRIFMLFTPFFMWNHICNAFVRNDGNPSIAMAGAALATAISPIIGILICCIHLCSKKCTVSLHPIIPSIRKLVYSCQVGVSAFVGEISSGVITVVFNMIILSLIGNIGVAAYGVVANTSLVAIALFNGIAQGSQPLISKSYGTGQKKEVHEILRMALMTSLFLSTILIAFIYLCAPQVTAVFNGEHNATLAVYAEKGLRLYFLGFFFAGINIAGTAVLSAVESVKCAFAASIMRGFVAIIFFAFLLSSFFGMTGVWLAFPAAEFVTMLLTLSGLHQIRRR